MYVYGGHEYQIYIQSHLEEVVNVSKKRILFINDSRNIHNRENNNDLTEKLHILVMFDC